jgi:hypothetical protein
MLKILTLILGSILAHCNNRSQNWPIDGSKIGASEPYQFKLYPFKNIQGLEGRSEDFNEVNYEMLIKSQDAEFNLKKDVAVGHLQGNQEAIDTFEESEMITLERRNADPDRYDIDRFQGKSYVYGNGKTLKSLRDSKGKTAIPDYMEYYFSDIQKYSDMQNKTKTETPTKTTTKT